MSTGTGSAPTARSQQRRFQRRDHAQPLGVVDRASQAAAHRLVESPLADAVRPRELGPRASSSASASASSSRVTRNRQAAPSSAENAIRSIRRSLCLRSSSTGRAAARVGDLQRLVAGTAEREIEADQTRRGRTGRGRRGRAGPPARGHVRSAAAERDRHQRQQSDPARDQEDRAERVRRRLVDLVGQAAAPGARTPAEPPAAAARRRRPGRGRAAGRPRAGSARRAPLRARSWSAATAPRRGSAPCPSARRRVAGWATRH